MPGPAPTYLFGPFRLDSGERRLSRDGRVLHLPPRAFETLLLLVSRAGSLVTREELLATVWGGSIVEEANVTHTIWQLRRVLDEGGGQHLETVPKVGYRFVAPVREEAAAPPARIAEPVPAAVPPVRRPRRLAPAVVLLAAGAAGVLLWWNGGRSGPGGAVSIAVLPFESIGQGEGDLYLTDGLTQETIAAISRVNPERLQVIGRTSTARYRETTASLGEIGRELGVGYLMEGSVRQEGARLRVTSALVRVEDQVQLWSESFDRRPTSALEMQQEVSTAIAEAVRAELDLASTPGGERVQTTDAEAYDLYLRGTYLWKRLTPATNRAALELFERATALDPDYALAWAGIAQTLAGSSINSDADPLVVLPRGREAAERAVRLQPTLAPAQTALGSILYFSWEWPGAERALRRAVELDPGDSLPQRLLGQLYSQTGRQAEGVERLAVARRIDPFSPMSHAMASQVAFEGRDYAEAVEHARRALALDSAFWIGHVMLGQAAEQLGRTEEAREAFAAATRLSNGNSKAVASQIHLLGRAGRAAEAGELLATLEAAAAERSVPPYALALARAGLGDRDEVYAWLERGLAARDVHFVFLTTDPRWDEYRSDERFRELLERSGLGLAKP